MSEATLLWHDYETWGVSPQKDLPSQFAAIRTNMDLEVIGEPINIMSRIANDYLPHPQAALVTGITPQLTLRDGMIEADFAAKIQQQMCQANTCVVGYNSLRFDDEVSRFLFYRNFYDPYAREWRNGNSRWDIIDLARACYALRPDGIEWPLKDDGSPSFKLEALTAANDLVHANAHDALSDVEATIALAKLIKQQQPKLYDYAFSLRIKRNVLKQINLDQLTPILHISSRISAHQGCATWVLPIAQHPLNPNAIIVIDLAKDPTPIINLGLDELKSRLYTAQKELADDEPRPGIKLIHINRSPFVTTAKAMSEDNAQRLGLNREACLQHYKQLIENRDCLQNVIAIYNEPHDTNELDADYALYSGGFLNQEERNWCEQVHHTHAESLSSLAEATHNPVLKTLLFRFRARNYPQTLTASEAQRWQAHRQAKFMDPDSVASITLESYMLELEKLAIQYENDINKQRILKALYDYAKNL
jgi:exodeoxyribonuclease-1